MKHLTYSNNINKNTFKYCILVPQIKSNEILKEYIQAGKLDPDECVVIELHKENKKTPVKVMKEFATELYQVFKDCNVQHVIVGDSDYYKVLTKEKKAEANLGYVKTVDNINYIFVPNYRQIFYDPATVRAKIKQSLEALTAFQTGNYSEPGEGIIKTFRKPHTVSEITQELQQLFDRDVDLTCDIEAFSLKHYSAGIGTITFCWNQNEGIAFPVDLGAEQQNYLIEPNENKYAIRTLLKDFFIHFPRKLIFHNASFDVTVLIYQLFMDHLEDLEGMLYGLEVFMEKVHDSKLVAYLATNTCAGNTLGLKPLSQEFSGNYSVDEIADITKIPLNELLQYNLIDGLSTWYVWNKYCPIMIADQQEELYLNMIRPALADIIQMQLTGLPIMMDKVAHAKKALTKDKDKALSILSGSQLVQEYVHILKEKWVTEKNQKLKKKRVTIADAPDLEFNPNSDPQLQGLLFEHLGLPVLKRTDTKQPSTKGDVIESLLNKTDNEDIKTILKAVIDFKDVIIILNTFISAFEKAVQGPSGQYWLHGNFNLGGTVSGRLSSNKPNLQNLPSSGTKYAEIIKQCFGCNNGWLFIGFDFASLEDRISALTTKDKNKLKVYTDGFDGHCLRAQFYFSDQMPDIDPNSVESINSIAKKYKQLRQDSKVPTFLLTYGGTWIGIMDKCGFPEDKSKLIESKYHELYTESDKWVENKIQQASIDGYVTVAFGLRVRTPLLAQVLQGTKVTPYEAQAEGRTAGNALGQSWGLLNTRACMAIMDTVRKSEYKYKISICAQIHDAGYFVIKDSANILLWLNKHVSRELKWQDHPDIYHPDVGLGGELGVFYPDWSNEMTLPNECDEETLNKITKAHLEELNNV